jgi:hypothetical protein
MAIDTNNEKLAVMEWDNPWEPGIPMDSTSFATQAHKQQLILGNPFPLFTTPTGGLTILDFERAHMRAVGRGVMRGI